jgi:hypothetical protein
MPNHAPMGVGVAPCALRLIELRLIEATAASAQEAATNAGICFLILKIWLLQSFAVAGAAVRGGSLTW